MDVTQIKAALRFADTASEDYAGFIRRTVPHSMLSNSEVVFLDELMLALSREKTLRVAELGSYIGGTTGLLAQHLGPDNLIEVYDAFEQTNTTRRKLANHPHYDAQTFLPIWKLETKRYKHIVLPEVGYLDTTTAERHRASLDLLYVDIMKHRSTVNVMNAFYDRLAVGGILIHQDYFHWQSPWIVYQMEYLSDVFELIGDTGLNMTVYIKRKDLSKTQRTHDYLAMNDAEILSLMQRAISRYRASKKGMLEVSRLRLGYDLQSFDFDAEAKRMLKSNPGPRVTRYLKNLFKMNFAKGDIW